MKNFNLFGGGFHHQTCSTYKQNSKNIKWDYGKNVNEITFYVDKSIINGLKDQKSKIKYGWLLESKYIVNGLEKICLDNMLTFKKHYKNIFTHNNRLIQADPDLFKYAPANGTWIQEQKIYNKTKKVSMICSNKQRTPIQKFRFEFAKQNQKNLDLFGRGFNEVENKEEALCDYMFSVCIENGIYESYFTEKILDCFATGTIPLYAGTPDIGNFFNPEGIIFLDGNFKFEMLTKDLYLSKLGAVNENLEKVKQYITVEDWLYSTYFKE